MTRICGPVLTIHPADATGPPTAGVGGARLPESEIVPDLDIATATVAVGLLAHWWSRPLLPEVDGWLRTDQLARAVSAQLGASIVLPNRSDAGALLDEYERLFVGPGPVPCPPYESYWREDVDIDLRYGLMGPCTAELGLLYQELALELKASTGELPDHLAIELEALAYALAESNELVRPLFFDHLGRWLPWFCRAVGREAEHPFYRELAGVTIAWLPAIERHLAEATRDPAAS